MITHFKAWFDTRRERETKRKYNAGKEFAQKFIADARVKDAVTQELENYTEGSRTFGYYTEFDKGIEDAVRQHQQQGVVYETPAI